jgi:hypothetical protein
MIRDNIYHEPPCKSCAGLNATHFLTCATVNLAPGWYERMLQEEERDDGSPERKLPVHRLPSRCPQAPQRHALPGALLAS